MQYERGSRKRFWQPSLREPNYISYRQLGCSQPAVPYRLKVQSATGTWASLYLGFFLVGALQKIKMDGY